MSHKADIAFFSSMLMFVDKRKVIFVDTDISCIHKRLFNKFPNFFETLCMFLDNSIIKYTVNIIKS